MSDLQHWLALNLLPDIGPVLSRRLLSAYGTPADIFNATFQELKSVEGVGESRAGKIANFKDWDTVNREIDLADRNDIQIIPLNSPLYPAILKEISGSPPVIYIKGELTDADKYAVAMVGSRASTPYGRHMAEKIANSLASCGLTVVSGMARGIDTASHRGALESGGRTIAVLGSGLDVPYPASNGALMNSIEKSGAVISEFPLGTLPLRENFPRRNRIISALSIGVLVVEATLDSGSLITVSYALEQGKDIFAVPGNINSRTSKGTNELIKNGAKLVESAEDIIYELGPQLKGIIKQNREKPLPEMTDDEKLIVGNLSPEPKHIDAIVREMRIPPPRALSILLSLELKGVVGQTEGKSFFTN
jgi:DNA processing protein